MLTSTIVPGINYSVVITHPLHQLHARKRSSSRCHMIETIANTWILIMSRQKSKSQNMASEAAHDEFVLFTVKAGNRTPAASEHYKRYTHTKVLRTNKPNQIHSITQTTFPPETIPIQVLQTFHIQWNKKQAIKYHHFKQNPNPVTTHASTFFLLQ